MKWIGQHIWDFISRFRNDVYLESISASAGDNLGLDGNGKIVKTGRANLITSRFNAPSTSHVSAYRYIPMGIVGRPTSITTVTSTYRFIAPRDGKISSITYVYKRNINISREFKLYLNNSGSPTGDTLNIASHTATGNYSSKRTETCPANWVFNQNDRVAIAFKDSTYTDDNIISILIEYDN
jgi:hypothetical protein